MKPSLEDYRRIKTYRINSYQTLHEQQKEALDLYEQELEIGIKPPYSVLRVPRARILVDVAVDHLISDNPVIKVKPRNISRKYQDEADLHEKFLQGWILTMLQMIREQAKNLLLFGECYFKTLVDPGRMDLIKDEPENKNSDEHLDWEVRVFDNFPLIILNPSPLCIFAHPQENGKRPLDVMEIYQRDAFEIAEKWEKYSPLNVSQLHYGDNVEWVEWWGSNFRAFFVQDKPVFGENDRAFQDNAYGFNPYTHAIAGYGVRTNKFEPHKLVKSLLYSAKDMIVFESRIMSQLDTVMAKFAHPTPFKTGNWDSSQIDYSPGHEIELPEGKFWGKDFGINPGTPPPPGIFETIRIINDYFYQLQPGVIRGEAIGASAPAYANTAMIGQARLRFGSPLMALEETLALAMGDGLKLAEKVVKKPLSVHGTGNSGKYIQTIKPEDINGYYLCSVDLEAKDPSISENKKMLGLRLWQNKVITLKDLYQDYFNETNATEKIGELIGEEIARTDPELRAFYVQQGLKYLGIEKQIEEIKEQQARTNRMQQWQAKKTMQAGTPEQQATENIMEGKNTNAQSFQTDYFKAGGAEPVPEIIP